MIVKSYSQRCNIRSLFSMNKRSGSKFLERSCSERDISALSYLSNKKRSHQMNEAKSEAQLFNSTLPDVTNTPCEYLFHPPPHPDFTQSINSIA